MGRGSEHAKSWAAGLGPGQPGGRHAGFIVLRIQLCAVTWGWGPLWPPTSHPVWAPWASVAAGEM